MTTPYLRLGFPTETSLAELYHENTKYHPYMQEAEPAPEEEYPAVESLAYGSPLPLPDPSALVLDAPFEAVLRARRSRRAYAAEPVPLAHVSKLLHLTYGVTGPLDDGSPGRAAPSAGARYPLEFYVAAQRVDGLAPGVWHYRPDEHALEPVLAEDVAEPLGRAFFGQPFVRDAALVLLVGAAFARTMVKYGERGYRLVLLDAGHAAQNAMLAAEAMGLGATGLGGFLDDALSRLAGLNGVDENVVYAVAVGRRAP